MAHFHTLVWRIESERRLKTEWQLSFKIKLLVLLGYGVTDHVRRVYSTKIIKLVGISQVFIG